MELQIDYYSNAIDRPPRAQNRFRRSLSIRLNTSATLEQINILSWLWQKIDLSKANKYNLCSSVRGNWRVEMADWRGGQRMNVGGDATFALT